MALCRARCVLLALHDKDDSYGRDAARSAVRGSFGYVALHTRGPECLSLAHPQIASYALPSNSRPAKDIRDHIQARA